MREFILGTDWGEDCDDAIAVRVLARAHVNGDIRLLGIAVNACIESSVESLDIFLQNEGIENLPIGLDKSATEGLGNAGKYQNDLLLQGNGRHNEDAEDGVRLYRRLLAGAKGKVDIVEIGFLQIVGDLLLSEGDDISPLSGLELVKEKVAGFWVMAGRWDEEKGTEYNFCHTARGREGASILCRTCPVPITFLGFEIGERVITGKRLPKDDMLKRVLCLYGTPEGRCSWDPLTAELALSGSALAAGYGEVRGYASVDPSDGTNSFVKDPNGPHAYVVAAHETDYYADQIEHLIAVR